MIYCGALNNEIAKVAISRLRFSSRPHFSSCSQATGLVTSREVQMSR